MSTGQIAADARRRAAPWRYGLVGAVLLIVAAAAPAARPARADTMATPATDTILAPYQYFVGRWSCSGGSPSGRALSADVAFSPQLEGRFIQMHHRDRPPGRYESLALWPVTAQPFQTVVHDDFGGMRRFSGSVSSAGAVLLRRDTLEQGARPESFSYAPLTDSTYLYAWHVRRAPGQPLVLGDSAVCRRVR